MEFDFSDRTALVTGGTRGIGRTISLSLAQGGADVIVNYSSNDDAAKETASDIEKMGRRAWVMKADVSDTAQVEDMFGKIRKEPGKLDILINNAGIIRDKLLMFMSEDDWDSVIGINLKGVYNCSKSAMRMMIGQKYGRIVNIVSPSAILGRAGQTNYASAKGGVISFTLSLARELARFNIYVNAVSPGLIETEMLNDLSPEVKDELLSFVPMKRFGSVKEATGPVLFLASDRSDYITGQVICVDGGLT